MSSRIFEEYLAIFTLNNNAKGNFQGTLGRAILKTGYISMIDAKAALFKANPKRSISFFTGHRVFEVLTKRGLIKASGDGFIVPYYKELEENEIPKLRAAAKKWADEFQESKK